MSHNNHLIIRKRGVSTEDNRPVKYTKFTEWNQNLVDLSAGGDNDFASAIVSSKFNNHLKYRKVYSNTISSLPQVAIKRKDEFSPSSSTEVPTCDHV